jgi:hypothetical protein
MGLFPPSVESYLAGVPRSRNSQVFVVDSLLGNDANAGTKWQFPLLSIDAALAKTVSLRNDCILMVGNGTSYATTAAMLWNRSFTHLIGMSAPVMMEPRTRIKCPAALATTPFITWSGTGCIVKNMSFWHETSNGAGLVNFHLSGGRNYFENCAFSGGAGANNLNGMRSLLIDGGAANRFKDCVIGNDTIVVPNGAAGLEFGDVGGVGSGAMHNLFEDCIFMVETNGTTFVHVLVPAAADVGRHNIFKRCLFLNEGNGAQASVFGIVAALAPHARILALDCWMYKVAEWCATNNGLVTNINLAANFTGVDSGNLLMITS